MTSIDNHTTIEPIVAVDIVTTTAVTPIVGDIIDTQNFEALEFIIQSGALGAAATLTPLVEESSDSGFSTSDVVDADFLLGTIANATFADTDDNAVKRIGYVGKLRYARLTLTPGSTASATFGAIAELGHARSQPTDGS